MEQSTESAGPLTDRAGWRAFGATNIGHWRQRNEDRFALVPEAAAYIVCDGMGGHRGGAEASMVACEVARERLIAPPDGPPEERVAAAARAAAHAVADAAATTPALAGMGTTLTLVLLDGPGERAWYAHAGDSRLYALGARLDQVSEDHSVAAEMFRLGQFDEEEARHSGMWHALTRALGINGRDHADVGGFDLAGVAALLLCTDGLSNMLTDGEIEAILRRHAGDAASACEALIGAALEAGGDDNVTAIVVMSGGQPAPANG